METVFLTLHLDPSESDFTQVKDRLALDDSEVDADYGVVEISPRRHLYTILVKPEAAARVRDHEGVMRISGNPSISALEPTAEATDFRADGSG